MNYFPSPSKSARVMLSALAIPALFCLSSTTTLAAPAPQIPNPYQVQQAIGDSATCAPQCILTFPAVPSGQRLIITNVSAQLGTGQDGFVIEGNGSTFFVPKAYPTAGTLAAPVMVYFEPASTPTARFFVQDATQHTSLIVTFVGYLDPIQ